MENQKLLLGRNQKQITGEKERITKNEKNGKDQKRSIGRTAQGSL